MNYDSSIGILQGNLHVPMDLCTTSDMLLFGMGMSMCSLICGDVMSIRHC